MSALHNNGAANPSHKPILNHLLREARKEYGWTQQKMANEVGVSVPTIYRWEHGLTQPDEYARQKLCHLFHKPAKALGFSDVSMLGIETSENLA